MILTSDQQQALSDFKVFLESDSRVFIMRGAAGTGKTTILKEFIRLLKDSDIPFEIMTPTGRAALVSKERTGNNAATIHRSIYELQEIPKKIDDKYVFGLRENKDTTNTVYFVDEASMVSDKFSDNEMFIFGSGRLLKDLFNYCNIVSHNRKIVFVGDHAQLPPVGQSISPALSDRYLKDAYGVNTISTTLTEVVRQASESCINQNAQQIRRAVDSKNFSNFSITDGVDVCQLVISDFIAKYKEVAKHSSVEDCIVITDSNMAALEYNQTIRECRYGQANLPIRAKDLLLITRNNYGKDIDLYNGTIVSVISVDNAVETQTAFVGKKQCNLYFRSVTILAKEYSKKEGLMQEYPISALILDDFLTTNDGALPFITQKALWANFEQRMYSEGIARGDEEFKLRIREDKYLNALQCKYGYAITCHKAQGGEWKNIFADMNKNGGKVCEDYFRWAYTAITRAKEHLWHISSPRFSSFDKIEILPIAKCSDKHISYYYPSDIDFKDLLYDAVKVACVNCSIELTDNRTIAYQHRFTFTRAGKSCTVSAWYGKKGYNGKIEVLSSSEDFLKEFAVSVCQYQPENIPYTPKFDAQRQMHDKICRTTQYTLPMVNIVQNQWSDTYYFEMKNRVCSIELFYNSKHQYTKIIPMSSMGADDEILSDVLNSILE
ncbi:MAG: AAA family ATPase [Rikenellaceae bacterium]